MHDSVTVPGIRQGVLRPGLVLSVLVLLVAIAWAVAPTWFTAYNPIEGVVAQRLQPPSGEHLFGTDQLGRDLYSRVVHGAALSLSATAVAVAVALFLGAALGALAGYVGGWLDTTVMRVMDVLLAIPGLLLALALVSALGFGVLQVAVAVGVVSVANFARVTRAEVLRVRQADYVTAARGAGVRRIAVLLRHVLPNSWGAVITLAALDTGAVLLTVSALSFLGFGAAPPTPEWGSLVSAGRDYLRVAWWLTTFPGLTISAVVLATNRVARALERDQRESW